MEGQPKVKVYTTSTCVYCQTLKEFFKEKSVEFEENDVSQNKEAAQEMIQLSGQMGVPVLDIGGKIVIGFDKEKISKLLNIHD